jgi:ferredoxin
MKIDPEKCTGIGACEAIAEDVFEVGDDSLAHVLMDDVPEDRRDEMEEAVEGCPTEAISIQD